VAVSLQSFDLNLLASLDALLSERNVTKAARRCHVTQSTMSGTLRRLRDQFDDQLLIRSGRRYDLSPLAQSLAISVRQILLQIEATVTSRPLFDPRTGKRTFRIMASDYATTIYLSRVVRHIAPLAPHLSFDILPINAPVESIRSGSVDLCVTGSAEVAAEIDADPLLRGDALFSDSHARVVDAGHPLHGRVRLEDTLDYPHVTAQFAGIGAGRSPTSVVPRASITVPGFGSIAALVAGTLAIGMIPFRLLALLPADAGIRLLDVEAPPLAFTERLLWHSRFAYDPAFGWLRSAMLETARD
jgi:LysR family nod box-dependent transcriptional activator